MSFFDLQRFSREQDRSERAARDLKLAKERIETLKWQQRSAEYEREQQHHQERECLEQERENSREAQMNLLHNVNVLQERLTDLKLRHKFGIEVIEE